MNTPTPKQIVLLCALILAIIYVAANIAANTAKPIANTEPTCWVESYPVKKLLRQVSWRDKTFIENANVHNALEISEGDMDFVLTVEAESQFDPEAVGDHGQGHGFCQWNRKWHAETLDNPNFKDPIWQMEKCFEYYTEVLNNGTIHSRLYGYPVRHLVKDRFKTETEWKLRRVCK